MKNFTKLYLTDLLHPITPLRRLRPSNPGFLSIPNTKLKTFGERAFCAAAPTFWNSLPADIRNAQSLDIFKTLLKHHLFTEALGLS